MKKAKLWHDLKVKNKKHEEKERRRKELKEGSK